MNLVKILKDCPEGTKLYSPIFGEVSFKRIDNRCDNYPIIIKTDDTTESFASDGKLYKQFNGECMLFPSKDNRDWSTFKAHKKEYEFKPFDKVLVREKDNDEWKISLYQSFEPNSGYFICLCSVWKQFVCLHTIWKQCIPYEGNEHLLGTSNNPD